jgi:hypothetical protein
VSNDKPKGDNKGDGASHPSIPPELRSPLGVESCTEAEIRDSAEVNAELAEIERAVAAWTREAEAEQAKLGVGNVSVYVAPVPLPGTKGPGDKLKDEQRVELAVGDVPRALPAGNPALPTQEISTRALREGPATVAQEAEAASQAVTGSRTVGGNTERMHALRLQGPKAASPWAKDAPEPVLTSELPSSLRPPEVPRVASEKPAGDSRRHPPDRARTKVVLMVAVAVVGVAVVLRATTTGRTPDPGSQGMAPSATPTAAAPSVRAVTPPPSPSSAVPAPSAPASSTASAVAPPPPSTTPASPRPRTRPTPSSTAYDPYDDPTVKPIVAKSAEPVAPPPTPPPIPATAAPRATATSNPFDKPNYE